MFFKLFGIDYGQSSDKVKEQSKKIIENLCDREQKNQKDEFKNDRISQWALELQSSIKKDKKKMV